MTGFFEKLIEYIGQLIPIKWKTVYADQLAVKFTRGRLSKVHSDKRTLKPGMHLYWTWFQDIFTVTSSERTMETQYKTLVTSDEREVTLSFSCSYKIIDPILYLLEVEDFRNSLENVIEVNLAKNIVQINSEVFSNSELFETVVERIIDTANEHCKKWGVILFNGGIVNVTTNSQSYRIFTDVGTISTPIIQQ